MKYIARVTGLNQSANIQLTYTENRNERMFQRLGVNTCAHVIPNILVQHPQSI